MKLHTARETSPEATTLHGRVCSTQLLGNGKTAHTFSDEHDALRCDSGTFITKRHACPTVQDMLHSPTTLLRKRRVVGGVDCQLCHR